jgi:hypothetical protein
LTPENKMSRRASVFARNNPGKRRVRFPDEVIFENEIKEQDGTAVMAMLRRASIDIDLNRINMAGQTCAIFFFLGGGGVSNPSCLYSPSFFRLFLSCPSPC